MLNVTTLISSLWPPLHATDQSNVVFVTDEELTATIADQLKELARNFGVFVVRDIATALVQGTASYPAPVRHVSTLAVSILETGRPLVASSTKEMENWDRAYESTQAAAATPVRWWYSDKVGVNRIGIARVPGILDAGQHLEVIYHQYQCDLDPAHTVVDIRAPKFVGDYIEVTALAEMYGKESDFQMPESAQSYKQLGMLYEQIFQSWWGTAQ